MSPELRITVSDAGDLDMDGPVRQHTWCLVRAQVGRGREDHRHHHWRCNACGLDYVGELWTRPSGPCQPRMSP